MNTNTIRFKTTVLYSSILGFILVLFSTFIFHSVKRILYESTNSELKLKASQIAATVNAYGEISGGQLPTTSLMKQFLSDNAQVVPSGQEAIDKLWEQHRWLLGAHKDIFLIVDLKGQPIMQSDNLPTGARRLFERLFAVRASKGIHYNEIRLNGVPFRAMSYPFTFAGRKPYVLHLAVPMTPVSKVLSRLMIVMAVGIIAVLFISLFIGSFLTRKILQPVTEVTLTANNITQKNLGVRIPSEELDEEMKLLVDSFNQMIDRLERSFTHINEFSSHAAHELKTPLAIIKGELELALSGDLDPEESRRVMQVALQEVDRLIRITKDLLLLARFEYNQDIFKREPLDLSVFLNDIAQHGRVLAAEKGVSLELAMVQEAVMVRGDTTHLRRLFFNLLHNAVKFTPSGGHIRMTVEVRDGAVCTAVADTGEGIAAAHLEKIFDKFFTIRRADHKDAPGNGLGLCLARTIARAHGGDITVTSELNKGSTFSVTLPLLLPQTA